MPVLTPETQAFFRVAYGVLLMATLLHLIPQARRFFVSERWGGYAQSAWDVDAVQNPVVLPIVLSVWVACSALLIVGWSSVWVALVNLLLCRYFFIYMRWKGILRGMGAPGFMTQWLAGAVFLLEYATHYAPQLASLTLWVIQLDFAFLYLSSGWYKVTAGYPRNEGMELGMVNPQWGHWWSYFKRLPPSHPTFKLSNQLAWSLELLAAMLMLLPQTRFWGGALLIVSFMYVAAFIRLSSLAVLVMLTGVVYFVEGSYGDQAIRLLLPSLPPSTAPALAIPASLNSLLALGLWSYVMFLPLAYAGLYYNFYARRRLPGLLQRILEQLTNFFGIIIWRVFTVDLINFFIRIYCQPKAYGERILVSRYGIERGTALQSRWGIDNHHFHLHDSQVLSQQPSSLSRAPCPICPNGALWLWPGDLRVRERR